MLPAHSCTVATALSVLNEYSAIALQFERKRCDKIADIFVAGPMGMSPRRAGAIRSLGRAKPAAVRRASRRIFVRQSHLFRSSTVEIVLKDSELRDAPGYRPDPALWNVAIRSCGYIQARQALSEELACLPA
jgi:hypothetical protein